MDSNQLNRWLTLAANIGVLAGIVFLALEIRQNSDLARMQFQWDQSEAYYQSEIALFGDRAAEVWEKSIVDPASLSLAEIRIMDAYIAHKFNIPVRLIRLEEKGLLEKGEAEEFMRINLPYDFGTEFGKAWWETFKHIMEAEYVQLADPIIEKADKDATKTMYLSLQRALSGSKN